jgi:hypothetical protein
MKEFKTTEDIEDLGAVRRILDAKNNLSLKTKMPEYQRLDIEPKVAGKSLLHDEFGMPKVAPKKRENVLLNKEIPNTPVLIKASTPDLSRIKFHKKNQVVVAPYTPAKEKDDGFIPPKSNFVPPKQNFVSVGNVEHGWYDEKVTGKPMIDNNYVVGDSADAVDAIQGKNPLVDFSETILENNGSSIPYKSRDDPNTDEARVYFEKKLAHVKNLVVAQLAEVTEIEELQNLRENLFGRKGIFTDIVRKLDTLKIDNSVIGELVSQVYTELDLEIEGKSYELTAPQEETEEDIEFARQFLAQSEPDPQPQEEESNEEDEKEDANDSADNNEKVADIRAVPEGSYVILIDGKFELIIDDIEIARKMITKGVLENDIALERVQLIKRIPIDFGIILG